MQLQLQQHQQHFSCKKKPLTNVGVSAHGGVVDGGVAVVVWLVNVEHVLPKDAPDDLLASVEAGVTQGCAPHGVTDV